MHRFKRASGPTVLKEFTLPQIIVTKEYLHLEPIGIVLVFFFFAIVVIQFIAMLFHR